VSKRLIIFLLLFLIAAVDQVYARDHDYVTGLRAYRDGLYDVAKTSFLKLEKKKDVEKNDLIYAQYLLYRLYMSENKYMQASGYLDKIEDIKDKRFNVKQIKEDRLRLLSKLDCGKARKNLFSNPNSDSLNIYLDSKCDVDKEIVQLVADKGSGNPVRVKTAIRMKEDSDTVKLMFNSSDFSEMTDKHKKFYAVLFYKLKEYEYFNKIYHQFSDGSLTALALNSLWESKKTGEFLKLFNTKRKKEDVGEANYCRALKYYGGLNKKFDCSIVDGCLRKKDASYGKFKSACLLKSGDVKSINILFRDSGAKVLKGTCIYGDYIISTGLLEDKYLSKLLVCPDRYKYGEKLLVANRFVQLEALFKNANEDKEYYYLIASYSGQGKLKKAKDLYVKIKDEAVKKKASGFIR